VFETGGLLSGLTTWHFRVLTDNPWNGGGGYNIKDVATWSLDQCWFRFASLEYLSVKKGKTEGFVPSEIVPDEDGMVKGRTSDGTSIKAIVRGKSLCRQLMEEEEEKKKKEKEEKERRSKKTRGKKKKTL